MRWRSGSDAGRSQTLYRPIYSIQGKNTMSLIGLVIVLIVVGVLLWLVNTQIPMDPKIKTILNVVVVICVVLFVLQAFGLLSSLDTVRVPQVH